MQTPCRVDDQHVCLLFLGILNGIEHHGCGVRAFVLMHDVHARAVAPNGKLVDGGGAERICRGNDHLFARFFQSLGDLADRGGLARAVHADDKDHRGRGIQMQPVPLSDQLGDDLFEHALDLLRLFEAPLLDLVTQTFQDLLGGGNADVCGDEKLLQFVQQILVHLDKQLQKRVDTTENGVFGLGKTLF